MFSTFESSLMVLLKLVYEYHLLIPADIFINILKCTINVSEIKLFKIMKVSERAFTMATKIISTFDSETLKARELDKITEQQAQLDKKLKDMKEAPEIGDMQYKKWDLIEKSVDISEKKQEIEEKQGFGVDGNQMKEMMGCSRDHSKEIDIYNKSYAEKLQRIMFLKDEGNQSYKEA